MGLVEWVSQLSSERVSKTDLFEKLFAIDDSQDITVELKVVCRNNELKPKLIGAVDAFTWDIVDEVFHQAKLRNVFSSELQTILAFVCDVMNKKEWEIVAFEKVYGWTSPSELAALLFSLQLLLTGDGRDSQLLTKVLSAVSRCLDKLSDVQPAESGVEHFLSFVNGYLCKSTTWRAPDDIPPDNALRPKEERQLLHLICHVADFVVSNWSGLSGAKPLLEVLLGQLHTLTQGDWVSTFSLFLHLPCVAFDQGLSHLSSSPPPSKAESLLQLLVAGLQSPEPDVTSSLTSLGVHIGSGFVLSLPWKESLDVLSTKGGSSFDDRDALPPNAAGMASLVLSVFVFPEAHDRYIPLILSDDFRRELLLAALYVLASDDASKGETKAWLFLHGIQTAFDIRDGIISLRNVERAGTEVFISKLASAGIDNFRASVSHRSAGFDDVCCLAVNAINTWSLSKHLLHLLAHCADDTMRKRVYVAWRMYLASFEDYSRFVLIAELLEHCPYNHIRVLLVDTLKDVMQTAVGLATKGVSTDEALACNTPPFQVDDDSVPGAVRRYLGRNAADLSRDALLSEISVYNICAKYERLRSRLESTVCRRQWQTMSQSPQRSSSILWSSWVVWRFWLKEYEKWAAWTTEEVEDSLELLSSHSNVLVFLAIRLAADPKARYLFLRVHFEDTSHPVEMLSEVLVTVVALRQRKLPEVADSVRATTGEASISLMKLHFLQSLLDYAEEKLISALQSLSV